MTFLLKSAQTFFTHGDVNFQVNGLIQMVSVSDVDLEGYNKVIHFCSNVTYVHNFNDSFFCTNKSKAICARQTRSDFNGGRKFVYVTH